MSSALNWLSSARGLLGGEGLVEAEVTELDEALALAKEMEKTGKGAWEGWSVEIEVLRESRRGIDGEESKLAYPVSMRTVEENTSSH